MKNTIEKKFTDKDIKKFISPIIHSFNEEIKLYVQFSGRKIIDLNDIDAINEDNVLARSKGINHSDILAIEEDFKKGIRYNEPVPVLIYNKKTKKYQPLSCYHRLQAFKNLKYINYIFDVYELTTDDPIKCEATKIRLMNILNSTPPAPKKTTDNESLISTVDRLIELNVIKRDEVSVKKELKIQSPRITKERLEKLIKNICNRFDIPQKRINYTESDLKNFLDKNNEKYTIGGQYDKKRRCYGYNAPSGYVQQRMMFAFAKYNKTGKTSTILLHTEKLKNKKTVEEGREDMINEVNQFYETLDSVYEYKLKTGKYPVKFPAFFPSNTETESKQIKNCEFIKINPKKIYTKKIA